MIFQEFEFGIKTYVSLDSFSFGIIPHEPEGDDSAAIELPKGLFEK